MNWLLERFKLHSSKTCIISNDRSYTYGDLFDKLNDDYYAIKAEIPEASSVALISDFSFQSISIFLALAKNKNIIAPLLDINQNEISKRLALGGMEWVVRFDETNGNIQYTKTKLAIKSGMIEDLRASKKPGLILFSSGTTGDPKGMLHDLGNLIDSYAKKKARSLRMLVFLMFDHIGGLNTLLNCLSSTMTMVLTSSRKPDKICNIIEKHQVQILPTTPTFLNLLLISQTFKNHNLNSLKLITYGTEYMPESLLLRLNRTFPNVKFLQSFGTSEVGIAEIESYSSTSNMMKITGKNIKYKIVRGELFLKSKNQIKGYLSDATDKFEDGWFKTGDHVEEADDGFIRIISRSDDIINVGGEKVYPNEVENVLLKMKIINECLVYALSNPITGESVAADVVLAKEQDISQAKKEIRKFCLHYLAPYKIPIKIRFVDEIEVSSGFKKKRRIIK